MVVLGGLSLLSHFCGVLGGEGGRIVFGTVFVLCVKRIDWGGVSGGESDGSIGGRLMTMT